MAVKTIKSKELSDKHRFVLDEYMQNGFNKSKSVLAIYDEIKNPSTAGHTFKHYHQQQGEQSNPLKRPKEQKRIDQATR